MRTIMLTKKEPSKTAIIKSPFANPAPKTKHPLTPKEPKNKVVTTKAPDHKIASVTSSHATTPQSPSAKAYKTRVTIKRDVGFNNSLTIRGCGANLSWEKGTPLKNISANEWIWETDVEFISCEFKVLLNDKIYETGENHRIKCNSLAQYCPHFPS